MSRSIKTGFCIKAEACDILNLRYVEISCGQQKPDHEEADEEFHFFPGHLSYRFVLPNHIPAYAAAPYDIFGIDIEHDKISYGKSHSRNSGYEQFTYHFKHGQPVSLQYESHKGNRTLKGLKKVTQSLLALDLDYRPAQQKVMQAERLSVLDYSLLTVADSTQTKNLFLDQAQSQFVQDMHRPGALCTLMDMYACFNEGNLGQLRALTRPQKGGKKPLGTVVRVPA